jgi:O-antigen/teichoic acid export membrane protein
MWIAAGAVAAAGFSFLFQALLSVFLADAEFGMVSSSIVLALALSVFASMGAPDVTLHLVKSRHLSTSVVLGSFLKLWAFHSIPPVILTVVGLVLNPDLFSSYYFIACFTAFLSFFIVITASSQSGDNFRGVAAKMVGLELFKLIAVCLVVILGAHDLASIYVTLGATFLLAASMGTAILSKSFSRADGPSYRELFSLGIPYAISGLMFMLYYRVTVVVLSASGQHEASGSLAVIYLFLNALLLLPTTFSQRYLQGRWHAIQVNDRIAFVRQLKRQIWSVLIFALPVAVVWFIFSESILKLIYPGRYTLALEYVRWFALIFLLRSICIPLQGASSTASMRWKKTAAVLMAAAATITVSVALAPSLGLLAGLLAALIAESVFIFGLLIGLSREWNRERSLT